GRLLSRRWRFVAWGLGVTLAISTLGGMFNPKATDSTLHVRNPFGIASAGWLDAVSGVSFLVIAALSIACVASLIIRFRRSTADERQQIKWFAYAASLLVAWLIVSTIGDIFGIKSFSSDSALSNVISAIAFMLLPI